MSRTSPRPVPISLIAKQLSRATDAELLFLLVELGLERFFEISGIGKVISRVNDLLALGREFETQYNSTKSALTHLINHSWSPRRVVILVERLSNFLFTFVPRLILALTRLKKALANVRVGRPDLEIAADDPTGVDIARP